MTKKRYSKNQHKSQKKNQIRHDYNKNKQQYYLTLRALTPDIHDLITQPEFNTYVVGQDSLITFNRLNELYPTLTHEYYLSDIEPHILLAIQNKKQLVDELKIQGKNTFLNILDKLNKDNYPEVLKISKDNRFKSYLNIEPTYETVCEYFNIDYHQLKNKYEQDIKNQKILKEQQEQLRKEQQAKIFQQQKQDFIEQLKQLTPSFHNYVPYVNNSKFETFTGLNSHLENVCQVAGYSENLAQELRDQEKQRLEELKQQAIEKEKKQFFQWVDNYKNKKNIDIKEIFNLLTHEKTPIYFNKPDFALKDLCQYIKLKYTKELVAQVQEFKDKIQSLEVRYCKYNTKHIHNMYVCDILNISNTELERWKQDKRLPIAKTQSFKKWGKTLESAYFNAKDLIISEQTLEQWRLQDKGKLFFTSDEKINNQWYKILDTLKKDHIGFDGKWFKIISINIDGYLLKLRKELKTDITIDNFKSIKGTVNEIIALANNENVDKNQALIEQKIQAFNLTSLEQTALLKELNIEYQKLGLFDIKHTTFNTLSSHILKPLEKKRKATQIIEALKIDQYEMSFSIARQLNRQINIVVGPTNSGKTYEALEALKKAKSGVYLAPLRLLALEVYEKLIASGIPCNLLTGEEHIIDPLARHTAATVEMMNSHDVVEVAVIDEFQMVYDKQRGWAWTAAMVGVPAHEVFLVGSKQALHITQELFKKLNESYRVIEKTRLSKLTVLNHLVNIDDLTSGDAVIAFSRKDVLSYSTLFRDKGFKVSTIYGALSPEVRRRQAELFNNGTHDIVVSTDAIGMGLNLPISRILFATINKFDGEIVRELNQSEIHQIAGRAGRYGIHEEGFVSLLKNRVNETQDLNTIKNYLASPPLSLKSALNVAPNDWHIQQLSEILKEKNIKKILIYFSSMTNNSIFQHANLEHMCLLYDSLSSIIKEFSLTEQYRLLCAPVSVHESEVVEFYNDLLRDIKNNRNLTLQTPHFVNQKHAHFLEQAETETKKLSVYMWLSYHYKNLDTKNIDGIRTELSHYVSQALTKQNMQSFSKMIEPYVKEFNWRHDNYNYYDDD